MTALYLSTETPDSIFGWPSGFPGHVERLQYPHSAVRLWNNLLPLLENAAPGVEAPTVEGNVVSDYWESSVEYDLMDITNMKHGDILKMAKAHDRFVTQAAAQMPQHIPTKGGAKRGIVTVAGGTYFPVFLVSLRMLRRTGSTIPVEVFLSGEDEYEPEVCTQVLPALGARCMVLTDIFDAAETKVEPTIEIKRFQYKIFAILFSTFDEVLFLDSDSFPLLDPELVFDSAVYKEYGMITWPDLWATTVSPAYYLIAGQEPPPIVLRASTESGQFFINKKTHFQTLLIAAYYNYFGESHYYLLLCQGGFGRGDKSTFVPAAIAANQSFYDVSERPRPIGQDITWLNIYALIQADPIQDHNLTSHGLWRNKNDSVADPVRPFFLHTNNPKWNSLKLTQPGSDHPAISTLDGTPSRAFLDPPEDVARVAGVERQLWEEARWVGCELETKFKDWKHEQGICQRLRDHFANFLDTPAGAEDAPRPPKADAIGNENALPQDPGELAESHILGGVMPHENTPVDPRPDVHFIDSVPTKVIEMTGPFDVPEFAGLTSSSRI